SSRTRRSPERTARIIPAAVASSASRGRSRPGWLWPGPPGARASSAGRLLGAARASGVRAALMSAQSGIDGSAAVWSPPSLVFFPLASPPLVIRRGCLVVGLRRMSSTVGAPECPEPAGGAETRPPTAGAGPPPAVVSLSGAVVPVAGPPVGPVPDPPPAPGPPPDPGPEPLPAPEPEPDP